MFKHILVPVDGSNTSMLAVSKAAGLAKTFGSAVTAVYVVDPYPFTGVGADFAYGQAQYINAATSEANAALEATRKAMAEAGVAVTTVVGEGHAVHDGILRALESTGADLIVMGSHGRRGLEKLVLGSVTQRVLGLVHVPVALYPASQEVGTELFRSFEVLVEAAEAEGRLRAGARETARTLWAGVHGVVSLMITKPYFDWPPREVLSRTMLDALFTGLLKP